ncbi:MAG: [FeFe] hydrogenase H-cluster maturation GTPase HydF [Elusimicrobiales bacterium]|jgi:[FeFe] hydrogenase H-cluster maturation GTPase HydF|nr:[FeFe] hydrogenase H-cluster maturation GTPase HydF [Elusimicrobiales bacterium]
MRLHIGIFGRTNTGKSSFINFLTGQDVSIVSEIRGTTTDTVEKTMELLPIGPVLLIDTAGIDDITDIGVKRVKKTKKVFDRTDFGIIVTESNIWGEWEDMIVDEFRKRETPFICVINKIDMVLPSDKFISMLDEKGIKHISVSSIKKENRDEVLNRIKSFIGTQNNDKTIINDILPKNSTVVLIIPIDKEAPKGRIILPQVQVLRELLDHSHTAIVTTDNDYERSLSKLAQKPELVVCDSQVVRLMVEKTPHDVKCTTFSILFSRFKGDMLKFARAAAHIELLEDGDRVAILEACSHHPADDDIGRFKIPKWISEKTGKRISFEVFSGRDFPENLKEYKLLIHCGACMVNSKEVLTRQSKAYEFDIPMTNYGMAISAANGCIKRTLEPFPEAVKAYEEELLK